MARRGRPRKSVWQPTPAPEKPVEYRLIDLLQNDDMTPDLEQDVRIVIDFVMRHKRAAASNQQSGAI